MNNILFKTDEDEGALNEIIARLIQCPIFGSRSRKDSAPPAPYPGGP